ncbi:hypothetical protein ACJDU8_24640 [Clostridium sp. WILCCON 0269]|uniref:L-2-amino-thiazoline-4-carboxylic acid hydrolase n=1 Tax=Candidatus Clostridium eludens TaxID=3381663 RepID=A0ABW8SSD7_9CLOT
MKLEKKIKFLENFYVAILADSVYRYTKEGILARIVEEKRKEQMKCGSKLVENMEVTSIEDVFMNFNEIFNCAKWEIIKEKDCFIAANKVCKLYGLCKKNGAGKPCDIYCLNPLESMIKGLNHAYGFTVKETLWDETKCEIQIKLI